MVEQKQNHKQVKDMAMNPPAPQQGFNLSEKIFGTMKVITQEDVKEFIRLLKEEIKIEGIEKSRVNAIFFDIDKLAGDKLIQ